MMLLHGRENNTGNMVATCICIDFNIRHGVTNEEVLVFLDKVRNDLTFSTLETM
jgi:hypothetical protein